MPPTGANSLLFAATHCNTKEQEITATSITTMQAASSQARVQDVAAISGYIDTAQAAAFTGLSESWFEHDRLSPKPRVPFYRLGPRRVRYLVSDLIAYGEAGKVAA